MMGDGPGRKILGSRTIIEVLNAENKLFEAKIAKVEAHKNAILTAYKIKVLMGELTAKNLKLKVKYFTPEEEFKNLKTKIFIGS